MNSSVKQLLYGLINAESENEVTEIVKKNPILSDLSNWKPYGGIKNNLGTINNQQQNPVSALVEKVINSIDAILTKECFKANIEPTDSEKAPKSMSEAVEKFFNIPRGDFSETTELKRRELADNIKILATGDKQMPNITILDLGEGQNFDKFGDTFVSLHKDNKIKIPFVQGKFNMGSTGVLRFCGEDHYQLILSKRSAEIPDIGRSNMWGFTLVRLRPEVSESDKHSWYEYCVDEKGEIFNFEAEEISLYLNSVKLKYGTLVKLYEYQLLPGSRSNITLDLWRELNRTLYYSALPVLLFDLRFSKGHATSGKILLGNKTRILVDENSKVEHSSIVKDVNFGQGGLLNIEYTVFKADALKTLDEFTSEKESIFLTVNGQTHATLPRSFIKSEIRLPYIARSLLVQVDCTNIPAVVKDKIFMASRDRMADSPASEEFKNVLARELREDEGLQLINKVRHDRIISSNPKETKFMEQVVSELILNDRDLINLLGLRGNIKDIKDPGHVVVPKYQGKEFPTFLKVQGNGLRQIPQNSYVRVKFQTDASNDYFYRANNPGDLLVNPSILTSKHLFNGVITTKLVHKTNAKIGEKERILVELTRSYDEPLKEYLEVEYIGPIEKGKNPPGPKPEPKGKDYGLPKHNLIKREDWANLGWTGEDIAEVVPLSSGDVTINTNGAIEVNINEDPDVLRHFLRLSQLTQERADVIKKRYYTSILLYSLVAHNHFSKIDKKDLVPEVLKSISKILLNLLFSDKFLKELESV